MDKKTVRGLIVMAVAVVLTMAMALPAGAGAAKVEKMKDFYTSGLQGDGTFNWVYCNQATRIVKPDGSAVETYNCELTPWVDPPPDGMGPDLGPLVYPDSAMRFEDETGAFYFSDFIYLNNNYAICMADTWREQLSPSGQVTFKAEYGPVDCVANPTDPCCYSP